MPPKCPPYMIRYFAQMRYCTRNKTVVISHNRITVDLWDPCRNVHVVRFDVLHAHVIIHHTGNSSHWVLPVNDYPISEKT